MRDEPVGFGIIGCGMIANVHARAIAASSGGRLIGAASRSLDSAKTFSARHGAAFFTDDPAELLRRPDINVVCITTPSGAHLDVALAAADAGKHLVVEKPLEISTARAERLVDGCRARGVKLAAIFQARFGPGAGKVKELVDSGRLGRLTLCDAYVKWYRDQAYYDDADWKGTLAGDGGGALMNQSIHAIDLLQWLVGMPSSVMALSATLVHERIEVEDTAVACLRFPHGALGVIEGATSTFPGFRRKVEISGEHGTVRLEDDAITLWTLRDERYEDERVREQYGSRNEIASGASDARQVENKGHAWQIQDMIDAIREDRPPRIDGAEGTKAVAIVEAIYASARSGKGIEL